MSFNTFGKIFRFTTWGESHGPAIGCVIDGCPPNIPLSEKDIQKDMDRRRPGQSKFTTQRKESDKAIILSGVFEGKTTGTPISIIIHNEDKRSRDYETIKNKFRPGHADYTYFKKYGIRDFRGGGRQSARETACRVAAGAVAKVVLKKIIGSKFNVVGAVTQLGLMSCDKGFVFYTNFNSRKGSELKDNQKASMCFHWKSLRRQVRAIGKVEEVSAKEADDYYNSRPYKNRIGAWASSQSEKLDQRETFLKRIKDFEKKYPDQQNVPRPPHWSGWRLLPEEVEFWLDGEEKKFLTEIMKNEKRSEKKIISGKKNFFTLKKID